MSDLYINDPVALRTKRRAYRIEIENTMGSLDKVVRYHQEDVIVDAAGDKVASSTFGTLEVPLSTIGMTFYPVTDPVTGQSFTLSGYCIALWLENDYVTRASALLPPVPVLPPV